MVLSIRKWLKCAVFIVLLILLTTIVYDGLRLVNAWLAPNDPYRIPQGKALKVFDLEGEQPIKESVADRLRLFYWYGE
ncbi:DUF4227 family protein [Paenibacillus sp. GCM10027626]|uniref:DUF4227 family protein n=1 Tax=Paenibacillus sp. GCM10027626 TaxID=3273411 RepID=UPI00362941FD